MSCNHREIKSSPPTLHAATRGQRTAGRHIPRRTRIHEAHHTRSALVVDCSGAASGPEQMNPEWARIECAHFGQGFGLKQIRLPKSSNKQADRSETTRCRNTCQFPGVCSGRTAVLPSPEPENPVRAQLKLSTSSGVQRTNHIATGSGVVWFPKSGKNQPPRYARHIGSEKMLGSSRRGHWNI